MNDYLYIIGAIIVILLIVFICFNKQISYYIALYTSKKRIQKNLYKACKANDYLIINDIYLPIDINKYKHVDTIIFGNKYIYIINELKCVGDIIISISDKKWRVFHHNKLELIDNVLLTNKRIISALANIVKGLQINDLKSIVVLTKTCTIKNSIESNDEFVVLESDVIKQIKKIEKESTDDVFEPSEIEKYCKAFYEQGLISEKNIARYRKESHDL
ncbi:MAG: NERD domain-containing protein [Erysipelotrichaceae bacterium]|nr:NERD domain-containing protein [Erysipelotrichaceae bacterium]